MTRRTWGRRIRVGVATCIAMLGTGLAVPGLAERADAASPFTLSTNNLDFGTSPFQGDLVEKSVTVRNATGQQADFVARITVDDRAEGFTIEGGHVQSSLDYCVFKDIENWGGLATIQLPAGKSCVLTISYDPGDHARLSNGLLRVSTSSGPAYSRSVGLKARTASALSSPASVVFGEMSVGGAAVTKVVTIKNVSGQRIELGFEHSPAIDDNFYDDEFSTFEEGGTCVVEDHFQRFLDNGKSCTISLTLATDQLGDHTFTLLPSVRRADDISYPWVAQTATIPVIGRGVLPSFAVTPGSYDFGNVTVGKQSAFKTFTVKNTSTAPERIGVSVGSDDDTDVTRDLGTCGGVLVVQPGKSCAIRLALTPHEGGIRAVAMDLFLRDSDGEQWPATERSVGMLVTGTSPTYNVSATKVAFRNVVVDTTVVRVIEVRNTSKVDVRVGLDTALGTGFDLGTGTSRCDTGPPRELVPGSSCFLYLAFHPTSPGPAAGSLTVDLVGRSGETIPKSSKSVTFSGNGVDPSFTITPTSHDFGYTALGVTKTLIVTVTNKSAGPISFDSQIHSASSAYAAVSSGRSPCSPSRLIPAHGKCTYQLSFTPGDLGLLTAQLNIWPNDLSTFTQIVVVRGTGFQNDS